MVIRMREYVAQTLESKNIQTVINIDEKVLNKTLDMNQRRDFFLIFKEAVNNIAKYADASEVQVKLEKKKERPANDRSLIMEAALIFPGKLLPAD